MLPSVSLAIELHIASQLSGVCPFAGGLRIGVAVVAPLTVLQAGAALVVVALVVVVADVVVVELDVEDVEIEVDDIIMHVDVPDGCAKQTELKTLAMYMARERERSCLTSV